MSTTVKEVNLSDFTDKSGKFHVGMTKKEVETLKGGIFTNYKNDFSRIDKNKDDVIDEDELLAEIRTNAEDKRKEAKVSFYNFLFCGLASRLYTTQVSKNTGLVVAIAVGVMSLIQNLKSRKLEKRADDMKILINQLAAGEKEVRA